MGPRLRVERSAPSYDLWRKHRDKLDVTGRTHRSGHGTAVVRPLPSSPVPTEPSPLPTRVRLEGDRIVVERLVAPRPDASPRSWPSARRTTARPIVERALRIGLLALQDAGVTVNVDVVRTEFERLVRQAEQVNERAAAALEQTLRANFADGDGRLPRTLEQFLGDRGALRAHGRRAVRRDEARQRHRPDRPDARALLRWRRLEARAPARPDPAQLPDAPVPPGDRGRVQGVEERLVAIEAAAAARGAERARSAAKGVDFEDLLEAMLGDLARGAGDLLDRTGNEAGAVMKSKKGDFVLTLDARVARGCDLRVVIEAKDRPMSMRAIRDELREARENRGAAVGLVVFTPAHAPAGVAPFSVVGDDVYCVIDPEAPEPATLEAAVRLARLLALASLAEHEVEVDAAAIGHGPHRDPRAARAGPHAQVAADLDLERHEGGLDRARHDALEHPGPGRRGRGRDPRRTALAALTDRPIRSGGVGTVGDA